MAKISSVLRKVRGDGKGAGLGQIRKCIKISQEILKEMH